jgi:dTMP kinase
VTVRYVALEGVEGAGKSTVAKTLDARLTARGREVVVVREPGGTPIGEEIRRLLLHDRSMADWTEAALFAAARAELVHQIVGPALDRGAIVLSDRTYYSSLAYQGGARGLGIAAIRALNEQVLDGVLPDLVVVLDVDPELGFDRETDRDRIGSEGVDFQRAVSAAYHRLAREDPRVVLLDTATGLEAVTDEILTLMDRR